MFPSSTLSATPTPPGPQAHSNPSAPPFAVQPSSSRIRRLSAAIGPRISSGWARIAAATCAPPSTCSRRREHQRHPLERQGEREHTAAVDRGRDLVRVRVRRGRNLAEAAVLDRMCSQPIAAARPALRPAEREHPGVLARAVVLRRSRLADRTRARPPRPAPSRAGCGRRRAVRGGEVRRGGDRDLFRRQVVTRADERKRLERLRRRTEIRDEAGIPRLLDHLAVAHHDGMHDVRSPRRHCPAGRSPRSGPSRESMP